MYLYISIIHLSLYSISLHTGMYSVAINVITLTIALTYKSNELNDDYSLIYFVYIPN